MKVFREVAACGSFSAAAESLSFTQSAVSQQVAALEREVGTKLLDRTPRGVRLTDSGRALVGHADACDAMVQILVDVAENFRQDGGTTLAIAGSQLDCWAGSARASPALSSRSRRSRSSSGVGSKRDTSGSASSASSPNSFWNRSVVR